MLGQVSSKGLRWGTDGDDGVGPSYHVMTITWCGGQPRGCPGGEPKRAATYRMADGISVEHTPTKLKLLTCL